MIYDQISFKNSRNIHKRWAASDTKISIGNFPKIYAIGNEKIW